MKLIRDIKRIRYIRRRISELDDEIENAQEAINNTFDGPAKEHTITYLKQSIIEKTKDIDSLERDLDDLREPIRMKIAYLIMIIMLVAILLKD